MNIKKIDIEENLKSVYSGLTPDVFESIITECQTRAPESYCEVAECLKPPPKPLRRYTLLKSASVIIAVVSFAAAAVFLFNDYRVSGIVDSVIALDVNPSFKIQVNEKRKVISAEAVNDEASALLDGMNLNNVDLNVAVNAIIGSMLKNGYLSQLQNSILVTVQNDNQEKAALMQKEIMQQIDNILRSNSISGAIVAQTNNNNTQTKNLAEVYGISEAKAELILGIINSGSMASFDQLAGLSINELNLILSGSRNPGSIASSGSASESMYIGEQRALEIAVSHAELSVSDVIRSRTGMDYENGRMVYEVEFITSKDEYEYEYEIDALTGNILEFEQEWNGYYPNGGYYTP